MTSDVLTVSLNDPLEAGEGGVFRYPMPTLSQRVPDLA